ncbi:TKL/TKL-ccin protein kinase [Coprinopsis sp. MPI-PUGE-AT-0042]|nr:TKL/TKL-ccin protein kinase [Coprinopsis sp. MPI-PUGE-AT-0042]
MSARQVKNKVLNVVLLGGHYVGKTSLVTQWVEGRQQQIYCPTGERTLKKSVTYGDAVCHYNITDTPGHDTFTPLSPSHLIGTHVCILMYSFEDEESLQLVSALYEKMVYVAGHQQSNIPIVMVGSKADTTRRKVEFANAHKLAISIGCPHVVTSSLWPRSLDLLFEECLDVTRRRSGQYPPSPRAGWIGSWTSSLISSSLAVTRRRFPWSDPPSTASQAGSSPPTSIPIPSAAVPFSPYQSPTSTLRDPSFVPSSSVTLNGVLSDAASRMIKAVSSKLRSSESLSVDDDPDADLAVRLAGLYWEVSMERSMRNELLSLQGEEAQVVLETLLWAIDSGTAKEEKTALLKLLLRLSRKSSSYPSCLSLRGVTRDEYPVTSGHFGEIWKGQYMEQKVCLKVIKVYQRSHIDHFLKVFCREAALWSQLKHMNVLPFYGIYKLQDTHERICLVSPWMENGTLREYLSSNGSKADHCVLAVGHGHACLADFGLASLVDGEMLRWTTLESTGLVGGTARWQAPELLDPEDESSRPTRQSDVYALGCVFYEIFTGNLPFHEVARDATVIAHVQQGRRPSAPTHRCALNQSPKGDEIWAAIQQCWSGCVALRPTLDNILGLDSFWVALDMWNARYSAMRSRQEEGTLLSASAFRYAMRFQAPPEEGRKGRRVSVDVRSAFATLEWSL